MATAYDQLCNFVRETALFESINSLLAWDERTMLPPAGGVFRAEQMTALAGLVHQRNTDPRIGEWLDQLAPHTLDCDPTDDLPVTLREIRRDYDRQRRLPRSLVEALTEASILGQRLWVEARRDNDFARFAPQLVQIVKLVCDKADALGHDGNRYDALLDEYEPSAKSADVASLLNDLGRKLRPLVNAIVESGRTAPSEILKRRYPIEAQVTFGKLAAAKIGFDFQRGRLDVTDHPFCQGVGPDDCRITTRYDEHSFSGAFFGTLHESGHGIYDQGLRADAFGLPLGTFVSLGIHESQSRLWENFVGRSLPFWRHLYPKAVEVFSEALHDVSLEDFYWAVNHVKPSLIRVEADEVTYNLHIIIRFELEQALVAGELAVDDLPAAWNQKYEHYLGIRPPQDSDGVLQDIHWSGGAIGYFPTYTLGNLYAAQLMNEASHQLGDLSDALQRGEFHPLRDWLRSHIHQQGRRYAASELVQDLCGEPPRSQPLVDYLQAKLSPLYGLS